MSTTPTGRARFSWVVPVIIVALAGLLVFIVIQLGSSKDPATEASGTEMDLRSAERRSEADLLVAGPVDAPVALVIFSDYQCPYCAQWNHETLPLMMAHADAGQLRIEWRDVNVFGQDSERAARASYAAAQQGKFWEYHDALFADGQTRSADQLSDEALIALATELGLDADLFAFDLNSADTLQAIAENQQLGLSLGAYSTPAFILGGEPIMGAQPSEVFEQTFRTVLRNAK